MTATAARRIAALSVAVVVGACGGAESTPPPATVEAPAAAPAPQAAPDRVLAMDPARLADDLIADERALRDPKSSGDVLDAAAHRQQAAYRALGRHPEWDPVARPRIPPELLAAYDRNIDARRQLSAMGPDVSTRDTLPAWRIRPPEPLDELMAHYRATEAASGVGWNYLAAINFIETAFGRIEGSSSAGAQGPMQFMPSTWAIHGQGGDIGSPRDSIAAAGRFLASHGFARNPEAALFRYNNSNNYVRAVRDYAEVLAADPAAIAGFYRWDVYVNTVAGDIVLPTGYAERSPLPVAEFLRRHPDALSADRMSNRSLRALERMLAFRAGQPSAGSPERSDALSRQFLGIPYGANSLIGSAMVPEQLVVDLERVDCFTYADYVEALKRSDTREAFFDELVGVRYRDGVVGFQTRKHFFTDWSTVAPTVADDVTNTLSDKAIRVTKDLNQKDSGGVYLPGLPVVTRTLSYIPSRDVDGGVLSRLRTGDYIGAYSPDGGLDVTHVGIFVAGPDGPVLRHASSLERENKVVDSPLEDYLRSIPGIVVLRPVQ
ncbi:lytic transglycosylase [Mycobacterium sp. 852013-51886_SCH5428379]|nr:lytic transglycosylase [Mycobacterium sp. 852013-51886_SCH5428379]